MPLSEDELQFVTFVHQYHAITGELLSAEKAKDEFGFPKTKYMEWMSDADVRHALGERGIDVKKYQADPGTWESKSLTPVQLLTANSLLDLTDTRSDKKKLQDLGVSTGQYQSWLRDPVFGDYLRTRAELLLKDSQHEAHLALLDKVRQGDMKAIAYLNEINGRYVQQNGSAQSAVINLQQMIIKIVEIIQEEVEDGPTAVRIAERMEALTMGATLAGIQQEVQEITEPEVAKPRELTPAMQKLMDQGHGVDDF